MEIMVETKLFNEMKEDWNFIGLRKWHYWKKENGIYVSVCGKHSVPEIITFSDGKDLTEKDKCKKCVEILRRGI